MGNAAGMQAGEAVTGTLYGHQMGYFPRTVQWYNEYAKKGHTVQLLKYPDCLKDEAYAAKFASVPGASVVFPMLEVGDMILTESSAILAYMARGDPIVPTDKKEVARVTAVIARHTGLAEHLRNIVRPIFRAPPQNRTAEVKAGLEGAAGALREYNEMLGKHQYAAGDALSLADFCIAPAVDSLTLVEPLVKTNPCEGLDNITAYLARIREVPGYDASYGAAAALMKSLMEEEATTAAAAAPAIGTINGHVVAPPSRGLQWYNAYAKKGHAVHKLNYEEGEHKKEPYTLRHPDATFPSFESGDAFNLSESTAILQHIASGDPICGTDRKSRARATESLSRYACETIAPHLLVPLILGATREEIVKGADEKLVPILQRYEARLAGNKFLDGESIGLTDFFLTVELDIIPHLAPAVGADYLKECPAIQAYLERAKGLEGYQENLAEAVEYVANNERFKALSGGAAAAPAETT